MRVLDTERARHTIDVPRCGTVLAKEGSPHVVVDADHVQAQLTEVPGGLRPNEAPRPSDNCNVGGHAYAPAPASAGVRNVPDGCMPGCTPPAFCLVLITQRY